VTKGLVETNLLAMARLARSRLQQHLEVHEDSTAFNTNQSSEENQLAVLGDIAINSPNSPALDSLAADLKKLHIRDSPQKARPLGRTRRSRPPIEHGTSDPLESVDEEVKSQPRRSEAAPPSITARAEGSSVPMLSVLPQGQWKSSRSACFQCPRLAN
jgi:hypothetical protein